MLCLGLPAPPLYSEDGAEDSLKRRGWRVAADHAGPHRLQRHPRGGAAAAARGKPSLYFPLCVCVCACAFSKGVMVMAILVGVVVAMCMLSSGRVCVGRVVWAGLAVFFSGWRSRRHAVRVLRWSYYTLRPLFYQGGMLCRFCF